MNIMLRLGQSRAFEQANFARIQGQVARQQAQIKEQELILFNF
jgi:hypothetical protein